MLRTNFFLNILIYGRDRKGFCFEKRLRFNKLGLAEGVIQFFSYNI